MPPGHRRNSYDAGAGYVNARDNPNRGATRAQVRVIVRKRPVAAREKDIVEVRAPAVVVSEGRVKVDLTKYVHEHVFAYDDTFGEGDDTQTLFQRSLQDLVYNGASPPPHVAI